MNYAYVEIKLIKGAYIVVDYPSNFKNYRCTVC
jgi:hypothetical protein